MSERKFRDLFIAYAKVLRAAVERASSERKLGQWERFIDWPKLREMMGAKVAALYLEVGSKGAARARATARRAVRKADPTDPLEVAGGIFFDEARPTAVEWAETRSGMLVRSIEDSVRQAIRDYVAGAIRDGTPVDRLARQLREIIGLRPDQTETLATMRQKLLEEGRNPDDVDRMISARGNRMLRQRAEMIARTETNAAQNEGARLEWSAQQAAGDLPDGAKRTWIAGQEGQCPICASLDGKHATIDGTFHSDEFGKDYHGPPAHPGCRCSQGITVP